MVFRFILSAFTFVLPNYVVAQSRDEVVKAELAFAGTAKSSTMKKAFLNYMDSSAVVFERGQILNGFDYWNKAAESDGRLLWHPVFHGLSQAGDLGFTTGPWEYRPTIQDSVSASGQYTTIWKKTKTGDWKFMVDLGISYQGTLFNRQPLFPQERFVPASQKDTSIFNIEAQFIKEFTTHKKELYAHFLQYNTWLNMDGQQPVQASALVLEELSQLPETLSFNPVAGSMSQSRDIGYIYGTVTNGDKKENYLRIWGHTKDGWKIILQVIKKV